jgi:hypothetical protein
MLAQVVELMQHFKAPHVLVIPIIILMELLANCAMLRVRTAMLLEFQAVQAVMH